MGLRARRTTVLAATNKIAGTVLDLRFANGDDFEAAQTTAKLFASMKSPLGHSCER